MDSISKAAIDRLQRRLQELPSALVAFSGGVDSSVLLAMMSRLNERPVKALTAGFSGTTAYDERAHARRVADSVGADHIEVEFTEADFFALLPQVASAIDDPTADYALLPTFKLAARARAEGLKVVISGEGGDELFGGYGRYRQAIRPWPFSKSISQSPNKARFFKRRLVSIIQRNQKDANEA